jgi:hypothetical protein
LIICVEAPKQEIEMGNNDTHIKMLRITLLIVMLQIWTAGFLAFGQSETAQQAVDRSSKAYGDQWSKGSIKDWLASGKIVMMGGKEYGPLDFTLTVKKDKVKRVVHFPKGRDATLGSDGNKTWHKTGPLSANAVGQSAYFIDSLTNRFIANLFDKNNTLTDLGTADKKHAPESASSRVVEVKNNKKQATRYYIDNATSLINRIEFDTGGYYTMYFGDTKYPMTASYVYSDYHTVNGFIMPYKIEVYSGRTKIEELTFDSVQLNVSLKDEQFVP